MHINDINVDRFQAYQSNVTIGSHPVSNQSQWPRGSLTPVLTENAINMKTITVKIVVKGDDRERICWNVSNLLSLLLEPVTLKLDGFSHWFRAVLKSSRHDETSMENWHVLTLEFAGYEYGREIETKMTGKMLELQNAGNLPAPCVIEITPTANFSSLKISGIPDEITVKNLKTGIKVIIDGEKGLMTEDGSNKFSEIEIMTLPYLSPGITTITADQETGIMIRYKPRYM